MRYQFSGWYQWVMVVGALLFSGIVQHGYCAEFEPRSVKEWHPFLEWHVDRVATGKAVNAFDVVAWAEFTHSDSSTTIRTGMFYAGNGTWKFRFTATRTGTWTFRTSCSDVPELHGLTGAVDVMQNDNPVLGRGFVTGKDHQWTWSGSGRAFVPQLAMATTIDVYHKHPERVEADLKRWYVDHGFNGIHTAVAMRWYDIDRDRWVANNGSLSNDPNPDPQTFDALERLITASYERGGMVHLWTWGDNSRAMTPTGLAGGINGSADRRLQRYIAARLGPLPGWTMGYGFDLWEWVNEDQLLAWHDHMHEQLGWPHLLGGRTHRHGTPLEELMTDRLDYIGYETHQPNAATYAQALQLHPRKPVFMEDRFRVRNPSPYPDKDYTPEMVRRGLWHSMMAGGVANIWGFHPQETGESMPFPNRARIKTYATFHDRYFSRDMARNDDRASGLCLTANDQSVLMFYWEDTNTLNMDLTGLSGKRKAVAIDTRAEYKEIDLGEVTGDVSWEAPAKSDWAVVVTTIE